MDNNRGNNDTGKMLVAILAGAAIGAGFGILYAPNKGSKTRGKIKHAVADTTEDISDWLKHAKDELTQTAHDKKEAFDRKLEDTVSNMSHKAENIITSMENKLEDLKKKNAHLQK